MLSGKKFKHDKYVFFSVVSKDYAKDTPNMKLGYERILSHPNETVD